MNEIWKDVEGYEGLYQVSNTGKVKSMRMNHLMHPTLAVRGYYYLKLRDANGVDKSFPIHRLVALAFIPNPYGYKCVNHIDENKQNNNADNLEWCTLAYNFNYGTARERQGISCGKPVKQITVTGQHIATYCSVEIAARINRIDSSSIHKCCKFKRDSAGSYVWRYV